ncbi:MAG: two-component system, NtrC family, response regulator AtoC [Thermoanaerobaculia bacterium]|jgi:DNA-binding response OmpR family regulator|nr:two-component system, NtrC family, response regulator AtoC [Thermoanaerobaculia bacterium]
MSNPTKDVLIVEDDDGIRTMVAAALVRAGLTCDIATDGVYAVEHLTEKRYTVLLLDMSMPRLDGAGVLKEIRAFYGDDSERPVVLVMTAAIDRGREPLAPYAQIVQAVITKPFNLHELRDLVQSCVALKQRQETSGAQASEGRA